jgi:large repetitive protein
VDQASGCTPGDPGCTSTFGLCPDPSGALACPTGNSFVFDDLAVIGTAGTLSGTFNLLTPDPWMPPGPTDPSTLFVEEYFNGNSSSVSQPEITTGIQTPAAFDEGGNFIRPRFGPLAQYNDPTPNDGDPGALFGDYHILTGSDAHNAGSSTTPATDIDGDDRTVSPDIGADEAQ